MLCLFSAVNKIDSLENLNIINSNAVSACISNKAVIKTNINTTTGLTVVTTTTTTKSRLTSPVLI